MHWKSLAASDAPTFTVPQVRSFFNTALDGRQGDPGGLPPLPNPFTLSAFNPATYGGRGGVRVLQQLRPFRRTDIDVWHDAAAAPDGGDGSEVVWRLQTANVARFEVLCLISQPPPSVPSSIDNDIDITSVSARSGDPNPQPMVHISMLHVSHCATTNVPCTATLLRRLVLAGCANLGTRSPRWQRSHPRLGSVLRARRAGRRHCPCC